MTASKVVGATSNEGQPKGPQPATYRDPKAGATWSGRGPAPTWLTTTSGLVNGPQEQTPESLLALVEYFELSLDKWKCVMIRHDADLRSVYVGDPAEEENELSAHGTIAAGIADEILEPTQAGANRISVGDQTYRFVRSFTHIADVGAVRFAPA